MDVRKAAEELQPHLVELRRDFHAHPETSGNEKETAERIVKELEAIGGYQIRTGVSGTYGIIAELRGALPGKTIALRADMDALSVTESSQMRPERWEEGGWSTRPQRAWEGAWLQS